MPGTTYHIKVHWTDGTNTEYTSSSPATIDTDEVTFTTSDGHVHRIQKKNTRDIETWTTTP